MGQVWWQTERRRVLVGSVDENVAETADTTTTEGKDQSVYAKNCRLVAERCTTVWASQELPERGSTKWLCSCGLGRLLALSERVCEQLSPTLFGRPSCTWVQFLTYASMCRARRFGALQLASGSQNRKSGLTLLTWTDAHFLVRFQRSLEAHALSIVTPPHAPSTGTAL